MITIIYSTHKDDTYNNNFKKHLLDSVGVKDVQILEFKNQNEYSLAEVYNKGIEQSEFNIVCCIHNDIKLEKGWGKKLLKDFEDNSEYGIIGKAGSCYFPESGVYWERMNQTMVGQVYHHPEGQKKWLSKYSCKLPYLIPVVTIDGLFISFDKTKIKHTFDESIGRFHFYDHPFSLSNYLDGVKLGVTTSFEVTHNSIGQPNSEFFESKKVFLQKYKKNLPLDLKPTKIYIPEIVKSKSNLDQKVGVIIPTKGKTELLFQCLDSFIDKVNGVDYEVFVADTGSSYEEKTLIKEYILNNEDKIKINLIEFDYYNFAKINNEIVKNYIDDSFTYIVFCNNDIQLLNNVIYGMLKIFKERNRIGTVGCRLHYEDNTVQHDGIVAAIDKSGNFHVSHSGLNSYYNHTTSIKSSIGNTAALLMIKKKVFEQCGFFNENYIGCFEDVELNLKCLTLGYENITDSSLVAYHLESQTRKEDSEYQNKFKHDYSNVLFPYVVKNINKFKNKLSYI
jgi:GT2 family glycosyltransferase